MKTSLRIVFEFEHPEVTELLRWTSNSRYICVDDCFDANVFEDIFVDEEQYNKVKDSIWLVDRCHFKLTDEDGLHLHVTLIKSNI